MRDGIDLKEKESAVTTACRHYWTIESADGPTSRGICKVCGEEKEFLNSWLDASYKGKDPRVLDLPNMLEDEEEEEKEENS